MDQNDLEGVLWQKECSESDSTKRAFWSNIRISFQAVRFSVESFEVSFKTAPIAAVSFAKIVIMEMWNIHGFFNKLKIGSDALLNEFPDLKTFRDSYAHIDERVNGRGANKSKIVATQTLLCGGLLHFDGTNWIARATSIFNWNFDSAGVTGIFALLDDWVVCSTSGDPVTLQINRLLK